MNDLKVAQEQVQESEERFRTMADSAPALIWMADMENRGTWFNKEWVEFTGRTLEEELGFGWTAGVHPDDLDQAVETCNAAFDAREEFKMEFRLRRRDGEYRWVLDHGVPRYGPDGQFQGYIGSCIDIHERKREDEYRDLLLRAGAALGSSLDYRQTLQQVVEIVVSGGGDIASIDLANDEGSVTRVAVAHAEGGMTDVLRQTLGSSEPMDPVKRALVTGQTQFLPNLDDESILKVTQGDAELLKLARMMHPSALLCVPMTWRGDVLGVFNVAMVNGRQFGSAEINLCQQLAARISGAVENAQLYEETRRAQDRQQFLVDAGTQLAATLDLEEALALAANLPVPELGDLCVVQLIGDDGSPGRVVPAAADPDLAKTLAEFAANYPDEARPEGLRIRAITERKTMFYPQVGDELIRGLTQSEPKRELLRRLRANSIVAVPLMAHNEPIGALTLAVTASSGRRYKQADALAAEAFAQRAALALLNARLYTRAQETQEVLRQLNVAKDEFVGMVSHELRTPITTVFSGARFLRSRADNLDDQTAREVLADIEQEAARLELIVENLLALARQEAGQEPEMGPLPINRVVKGVVSRMQNLRPSRPFQLTPADDPQLASGVPIYLELVLRNLLDNADKYSPAGKPVEITSRCVTGTVNVHVRDHGPGLNEADAEKVFEQFYRSGASNGVSGTGVGLAVCQRLMESQGGTISLSNHKDGGLEACLTLPVFREDIGQ